MFLEANINEVFLTAGMSLGGPTGSGTMSSFQLVGGLLDHDDRKRLDGTWQLADRASLLERYQFVLGLLGKEPMDQGAAPFQPVRDLGDVRNRLIHFKEGPNEVGSEPRKFEKTLHRLLGGKGFKAHPYTTAQNQFFPDQFFGYAGCRWAWETADAFAQEFHRRLGVEPAYQIFRSDLTLD